MKKLVFLLPLILISCVEPTHKGVDVENGVVLEYTEYSLQQVTIDGCEYLYRNGDSRFGITHKGNCTNPIHDR